MPRIRVAVIALVVATSIYACSSSTQESETQGVSSPEAQTTKDLAADVRLNMEPVLASKNIEVVGFTLSHQGGNEYIGKLTTVEPGNREFTYPVNVSFDGKRFSWEILSPEADESPNSPLEQIAMALEASPRAVCRGFANTLRYSNPAAADSILEAVRKYRCL